MMILSCRKGHLSIAPYELAFHLSFQPLPSVQLWIKSSLENLLASTDIRIHQVAARVKSVPSFAEKFEKKNHKYDSLSDVTDLVGLRVITYLENDVDIVFNVLKENFEIDDNNSIDKRIRQSANQFGYQSLHLVAKLGKERFSLPEYQEYRRIPFEIQIRSILQHSWAEIEHDINYKAISTLPIELSRKLHRAAALLEQADEIFSEIGRDLTQNSKVDSFLGDYKPIRVCAKLT